ncbi:hypothetical protein FA95DRAFT_1142957 [Auriscalpium vulgare]|uniref:Uncharacterized protein n=1 Tax=Auriscalpium vulgare TaxID=40419 RepID=A0ACB8R411_9AGAM|nr:hypothetical protein FA95DRAFT_1142957 [Auriscalpium vulgare]
MWNTRASTLIYMNMIYIHAHRVVIRRCEAAQRPRDAQATLASSEDWSYRTPASLGSMLRERAGHRQKAPRGRGWLTYVRAVIGLRRGAKHAPATLRRVRIRSTRARGGLMMCPRQQLALPRQTPSAYHGKLIGKWSTRSEALKIWIALIQGATM